MDQALADLEVISHKAQYYDKGFSLIGAAIKYDTDTSKTTLLLPDGLFLTLKVCITQGGLSQSSALTRPPVPAATGLPWPEGFLLIAVVISILLTLISVFFTFFKT